MNVYRSPMEKILKQMEDNEVIANPKQHFRSLLNKIIYRCAYHADRLHHKLMHASNRPPKA